MRRKTTIKMKGMDAEKFEEEFKAGARKLGPDFQQFVEGIDFEQIEENAKKNVKKAALLAVGVYIFSALLTLTGGLAFIAAAVWVVKAVWGA